MARKQMLKGEKKRIILYLMYCRENVKDPVKVFFKKPQDVVSYKRGRSVAKRQIKSDKDICGYYFSEQDNSLIGDETFLGHHVQKGKKTMIGELVPFEGKFVIKARNGRHIAFRGDMEVINF